MWKRFKQLTLSYTLGLPNFIIQHFEQGVWEWVVAKQVTHE